MPSLDGVNATPELTDIQFNFNDLIPIYDVSERTVKATTFHDLLRAWGYHGTAVIDALRAYKAKYPPRTKSFSGSGTTAKWTYSDNAPAATSTAVPMDDQYFTTIVASDQTSTLTRNPDCWAARFDLSGVAFHGNVIGGDEQSTRRGTLIGPKTIAFATHHSGGVDQRMTFTNAGGQRFTYRIAQSGGSFSTSPTGGYSSKIDLKTTFNTLTDDFTDIGIAILEGPNGESIDSVDDSLTIYEIAKIEGSSTFNVPFNPPKGFTYVLDTRSRISSNAPHGETQGSANAHLTPPRQRVHWRVVSTAGLTGSTNLQLDAKTSSQTNANQVTFEDYFDGRARFKDSGDPVFLVDDDNTLKILGCYDEDTKVPVIGTPIYSGSVSSPVVTYAGLDALDTFLTAWGTTRVV
tara:strand:+ start:6171 stop:7385 length:1215 start_codon:yes stop_codon:yes gene_type:complete